MARAADNFVQVGVIREVLILRVRRPLLAGFEPVPRYVMNFELFLRTTIAARTAFLIVQPLLQFVVRFA